MNKKTKIKTKLSIISMALIAGLSANAFAGYYVMIPVNTMPQIIDETGNPADLPPLVGEPDDGSGSGSGSGEVNPPLPPNPLDDPEAEPSQDWLAYLKDHGDFGSPMQINSMSELEISSKNVRIVKSYPPYNLQNTLIGIKSVYNWVVIPDIQLNHLIGVKNFNLLSVQSSVRSDLDSLKYMENVERLEAYSMGLNDISGLRSLKNGGDLFFSSNNINKLPVFDNSVFIRGLYLDDNNISSISVFKDKDITIGNYLSLQDNPITDLSGLNDMKFHDDSHIYLNESSQYKVKMNMSSDICQKLANQKMNIHIKDRDYAFSNVVYVDYCE